MKKAQISLLSAIISAIVLFPTESYSAPSSKGRFGLGGQTGVGNMPSAISMKYGITDGFKLNGLGGFRLENNNILLSFGLQAEFAVDVSKNVQPYIGVGLFFAGANANVSNIDLAPLFGIEYFITPDLTFDASVGLPISLSSIKDQGMKFNGITTSVNPVFGFHYYF